MGWTERYTQTPIAAELTHKGQPVYDIIKDNILKARLQ